MPGRRLALLASGGERVIDHVPRHAILDESYALLGHALKVKGKDNAPRVVPIVPNGDVVAGDLLAKAAVHKAAPLLDGQRAKAKTA
jgi:hypothetical protein